jgi:tRNA(Ile)-lysidine synthase
MIELTSSYDLHLSVLHIDHQLRGAESDQDAAFVRELAERLNLPFHTHRAEISKDDNLEQAARNARYSLLREFIARGIADRIALGHTRSDQAETVLFRFLRGSGTAGLAGIRPVTTDGFVRPLIAISREDVERYLRERGIAWREDSTNADPSFARNRIRHLLLPELTREWNPALPQTLAQTAEWALGEEEYWAAEMDRLTAACLILREPVVLFPVSALNGLSLAAARRLVRRAVEIAKGDLRAIGFPHIEHIRALAAAPGGSGRLQVPGVDVFRSFEWIRLAPPGMDTLANRNFRVPLTAPGAIQLPPSGISMSLELIDPEYVYNNGVNCLDWQRLNGPLQLRNWRPGDQYKRVGHAGEEKIKTLFQDARIPLWERRNWPVITLGDVIVWARNFGPASDFAATAESRKILLIRETAADGGTAFSKRGGTGFSL